VSSLRLSVGDLVFEGRLEEAEAPRTCAAIRAILPFSGTLIHVRWSGEAVWMPLGDRDIGVGPENPTSYPAPGQLLFHPAGISEAELLIAYGPVRFASRAGQLAGNHFATLTDGLDRLAEVGRRTLWQGAQPFRVELA
jgi:hypothetical protein